VMKVDYIEVKIWIGVATVVAAGIYGLYLGLTGQ